MNPMMAFIAAAKEASKELAQMAQQVKGIRGGLNFEPMSRAFQFLGQTLGLVVTPVLALFGAGLITVVELLSNDIKNSMGGFVDGVIEATKAAISLGQGLWDAYKATQSWYEGLGEKVGDLLFGKAPPAFWGPGPVGGGGGPGGGQVAKPPEPVDVGKLFGQNLGGIIQEMRMQVAPSGYSGIADASKRLQTQTFQSTIQSKILSLFEQTVRTLEQINGGIGRQRPAIAGVP